MDYQDFGHIGNVIRPDEVAMLQQTLREWCAENGVDPSSPRATHVAGVMITKFHSGQKTPDAIKAALRAR
jgi:hypothetical protein